LRKNLRNGKSAKSLSSDDNLCLYQFIGGILLLKPHGCCFYLWHSNYNQLYVSYIREIIYVRLHLEYKIWSTNICGCFDIITERPHEFFFFLSIWYTYFHYADNFKTHAAYWRLQNRIPRYQVSRFSLKLASVILYIK